MAKLRTALIIALSEGALCLCFLLLGNAGRAWTMGIGMALVGTVAGFLHFTALRIGVFASGREKELRRRRPNACLGWEPFSVRCSAAFTGQNGTGILFCP